MERVMLTMPAELLREVDELAQKRGRKRSQLVRDALGELLERERRREFEELLAEGYCEQAEVLAELAEDFTLIQAQAWEKAAPWDD